MKPKFSILIAEDDAVTRNLLMRLLVKAGYEVVGVENGRKALEAFKQQFFHIVITDWMMPELDGIGLCHTIRRKIMTDSYVFIILLTAKNSHEDILNGLKSGADDYLVKPFNPGELMARINTGVRILTLEMARNEAEKQIRQYSESLEEMVWERTQQLRSSEEKYRTIIENIEDGYYELDIRGRLTFFNDSTLKFGEYSKEELLNKSFNELTSEETANDLIKIYSEVYNTGKPAKRVEWLMRTKSGKIRFMDSSVSLIRAPDGTPSGFRGIVRDVTDQKRLETQLIEKKRAAEAASQAKSEFLANMSHEIRTPVNGIIGMTELVMESDLDDEQRELLGIIDSEANALSDLINNILDFSKIEAKKMVVEQIPFDLLITMDDLIRIMKLRSHRKGLNFKATLSTDLPSHLIGDPSKLRQILMNLFTNALKFTHTGEIGLSVEVKDLLEDQVKLQFSIKDTGIGIAPEKQTTIFEPFTQADGSTTRKYGGTGLGTTISKQLTHLMGGEIGCHSELTKGSTFWFTVLLGINADEDRVVEHADIDLRDRRVLMVHAGASILAEMVPHFRSWRVELDTFTSGKEVLTLLQQSNDDVAPYALAIIGNLTSDLDGFALSQHIREITTLTQFPIILLTTSGKPGDAQRCREIGINGYLTGEIKSEQLHDAMTMVLAQFESRSDPPVEELITRYSLTEAKRRQAQILLVEDYPTNQQLAKRHLCDAGYAVDLAENGQLAVEAYQRKPYDLILMDMQMPVMDGYSATKTIRIIETQADRSNKKHSNAHIPIIATTAHAMKGDRELCLQAGVDDYITKPLRKKKLLGVVEKWLAQVDQQTPVKADDGGDSEWQETHSQMADNPRSDIPIDFERAIAEFEGDETFFLEILKAFLIQVQTQIETLKASFSEQNAEVIRKEAHSIKGGAADLTAMPFSEIAFQLETIGKAGELENGAAILERFEDEYRRLQHYVTKIYPETFNDLPDLIP